MSRHSVDDKKRKEKRRKRNAATTLAHRSETAAGTHKPIPSTAMPKKSS